MRWPKHDQEEMLEIKSTVIERENDLDWIGSKCEIINLKICQQKLDKLKCEENKEWKHTHITFKHHGGISECTVEV